MTSLPSEILAALTDPKIFSLTLCGEASGEPIEGQVGVGCAIRNRVADGRWGHTYRDVCLANWQFSTWKPEGGLENYQRIMALAQEMATSERLPNDSALKQCAWVAQGIMGDWIRDSTKKSTHYFSPSAMVPKGTIPKWAIGHTPAATIGRHLFFSQIR